jgi:hypothetical protein
MKQRRHTPEQIIRKLREVDRLLARARKSPRSPSSWRVSEATIILAAQAGEDEPGSAGAAMVTSLARGRGRFPGNRRGAAGARTAAAGGRPQGRP